MKWLNTIYVNYVNNKELMQTVEFDLMMRFSHSYQHVGMIKDY